MENRKVIVMDAKFIFSLGISIKTLLFQKPKIIQAAIFSFYADIAIQ